MNPLVSEHFAVLQTRLLCIILLSVTDGATTTTAADAATEPRLQLCDSWQRIVDGQWTIAVSVRNTSSV